MDTGGPGSEYQSPGSAWRRVWAGVSAPGLAGTNEGDTCSLLLVLIILRYFTGSVMVGSSSWKTQLRNCSRQL